jgi:predicted aconitase/predicted aconitase with swiveling domain
MAITDDVVRSGVLSGRVLVPGTAEGEMLFSATGLSFWGGIDPVTGVVIDRGHPLHGRSVAGRILAIPAGRGSCTGSSVLMQLLVNDVAPAAIVFSTREEILTLGVIVAEEMFGRSIPLLALERQDYAALAHLRRVCVRDGCLFDLGSDGPDALQSTQVSVPPVRLTEADRAMLSDEAPKAVRTAMRVIVRMAELLGAAELIDIAQVHVDGCIYTGPASLAFARMLVDWGGTVRVPTTLNAISVDQQNWRGQGTDPALSRAASDLADAYLAMGARTSFTCAPYLRDDAPRAGTDIAWAESNAVVFANSVLGARTMKYPDFLDVLIALTGRAPKAGCHLAENRRAAIVMSVTAFEDLDDSFWPVLGYHAGILAPTAIPVITGLERLVPDIDDLKAFGAAFATTSGAPMFHIAGITPEAATVEAATGGATGLPLHTVSADDLAASWRLLQGTETGDIDLVALGNPHFSLAEFGRLAELVAGRQRHAATRLTVTTSRATLAQAERAGHVAPLIAFGAEVVVDACWCTVMEPIVPPAARVILTNSGKYAHYGPGLTGKALRFTGLADCVEAACSGRVGDELPIWLQSSGNRMLV